MEIFDTIDTITMTPFGKGVLVFVLCLLVGLIIVDGFRQARREYGDRNHKGNKR